MHSIRKVLPFMLVTLLTLPVSVNANMWSCTHNNLLREVSVEYGGDGAIPCNVVYNKPTEGEPSQVLWFADNVEGYCEQQAEGFVAKLESWGWACVAGIQPEPDE